MHGQISSITGTGFSQRLYYADGPFDKLSKPVTQPGSMDYPGKQQEMSFGYNEWGALVKDESRGITNIEYDNNGNPYIISYSDGSYTKNIYSANGEKLISELCTDLSAGINPLAITGNEDYSDISSYGISGNIRTEYRGPVIFRNGQIEMIRFPGGYATISGNNVTFHYYVCDYLGNNRAVINGSTGQIEQNTAYYPFGGVIADLGTGNSGQPYKFEGKELLDDNVLNVYDLGARLYYPAITQFDRIDRLSEKYYWLSPYLYCGNNPVNYIDRNGMDIWKIDEQGHIISIEETKEYDMISIQKRNDSESKFWKGEYGSLIQSSFSTPDGNTLLSFKSGSRDVSSDVFEFLAGNTSVEWMQLNTDPNSDESLNHIITSHENDQISGAYEYIRDNEIYKNLIETIHNHPGNHAFPSGLLYEEKRDPKLKGDIQFAGSLDYLSRKNLNHKIYIPGDKQYIQYSKSSTIFDYPNLSKTFDEIIITP